MFDARQGRPFSLPQQGNTEAQNFYFIITIYILYTNIIYTILYTTHTHIYIYHRYAPCNDEGNNNNNITEFVVCGGLP